MDYYLRLQELRQHINIVQAAQDGRLDLVKIALGRNEKDTIDTAFTRAAWHGHLDIVKFLLEMGADIHAERERALEEASAYGHADVVSFLLKSGADVHANHDAALMFAATKEYTGIVGLLLDYGADKNVVMEYARRYRGRKMVEYLERIFDIYENKPKEFDQYFRYREQK